MGKIEAKSMFQLVPLIGDLGRFLYAFTLKSKLKTRLFRQLQFLVFIEFYLFFYFIIQLILYLYHHYCKAPLNF